MIALIIKLSYQSIFGVDKDWTLYFIQSSETLLVEPTGTHINN